VRRTVKLRFVIIVFVTVASLVACNEPTDNEPTDVVRVIVAVQAKGAALRSVDYRLIQFAGQRPRTSSGQYIEILHAYPSADRFLGMVESNPNFDIVIFDSPDQMKASETFRSQLQDAMNVCEAPAKCPASIRPGIAKEKQEAVQQVFRAITTEAPGYGGV